jgi:hypothetical protein
MVALYLFNSVDFTLTSLPRLARFLRMGTNVIEINYLVSHRMSCAQSYPHKMCRSESLCEERRRLAGKSAEWPHCCFFTQGKNSLMNQRSFTMWERLRTILSTSSVQKSPADRVELSPAAAYGRCVYFTHEQNKLMNQWLVVCEAALLTILSTNFVQKCTSRWLAG